MSREAMFTPEAELRDRSLAEVEVAQAMLEADDPNVKRIPHEEVVAKWRRQRAELVKRAGKRTE